MVEDCELWRGMVIAMGEVLDGRGTWSEEEAAETEGR